MTSWRSLRVLDAHTLRRTESCSWGSVEGLLQVYTGERHGYARGADREGTELTLTHPTKPALIVVDEQNGAHIREVRARKTPQKGHRHG